MSEDGQNNAPSGEQTEEAEEKAMRGGLSAAFRNLRFETIGSISAIIMSVAAIFVAWDQSMVMRAQQHATVWPILDTYFTTDYDENNLYFQLIFENAGVGPAIIHWTYFYLRDGADNDGVQITHYSELGPYFPAELHQGFETSGGGFARALGPERQDILLQFVWPNEEPYTSAHGDFRNQVVSGVPPALEARVCYCSVFDRCWLASTYQSGPHQRVASCRLDEPFEETFLAEFLPEETGTTVNEVGPAPVTDAGVASGGNASSNSGDANESDRKQ